MILTDQQIADLLQHPNSKDIIKDAIKLQKDHKVHITGEGYEDYLIKVKGYEDAKEFGIKKELTQPVTKRIAKRIINEQSRWLNAQGTNKVFQFKKEDTNKEFREDILSQVWKEQSMDYFIAHFYKDALYTDFNGFMLVEEEKVIVTEDGRRFAEREGSIREIEQGEEPKPYLIFIPIEAIIDYNSRGNQVEYIMYSYGKIEREGKEIELARVIDDAFDYIFEKGPKAWVVSPDFEPIPSKLNYVPAIQISTLPNSVKKEELKISFIDQILPQLNLYLTTSSEHAITTILHSHPVYYQMGMRCRYKDKDGNECDDGYIYTGKEDGIKCPQCSGVGHSVKKSSSEAIIIPQVTEDGTPFNIQNVAGYVTPPIEGLQEQRNDLDWLEKQIFESATGAVERAQTDGRRTATEVEINSKPLEDIISHILDTVEEVETFLTDTIGRLYKPDQYEGAQINYGRKLNLRDENVILKEIEQAKTSGSSTAMIKALVEELINSRYQRVPLELERQKLMLETEPMIGYTNEEIAGNTFVDEETKRLKFNYTDLVTQFELENGPLYNYESGQDFDKRAIKLKDGLIAILAKKPANSDPQPTGEEAEG